MKQTYIIPDIYETPGYMPIPDEKEKPQEETAQQEVPEIESDEDKDGSYDDDEEDEEGGW